MKKNDNQDLGADAAVRLQKMANFLRDLVEVARKHNGPREHWEFERRAEIAALQAGIRALEQVGSGNQASQEHAETTRRSNAP